ncbi:MAG: hypothetical protein QW076_05485 [Candidatus Anstonellales archaeon]
MKIAIVSPTGLGGVPIITSKLTQALKDEGFQTDLVKIRGGVINSFNDDLKIIRKLNAFEVILYMGSVARMSSILLRKKFIGLFIHGFLLDEYRNAIIHNNARTSLGALVEFTWWKMINMSTFKPNFYIFHSKTACKNNIICNGNCVILPQFILSTEVNWFEKFSKRLRDIYSQKDKVFPIILSYTSFANSPRLLSFTSLLYIARRLSFSLKRDVLFYIIDPKIVKEEVYQFDRVKVVVRGFMPRVEFLKLMAFSDLYIEPSIDEEIGFDSIEAGLFKIPIAKITHPQFIALQDYSRDEVIVEKNLSLFVNALYEYINNIEQYKDYYSKRYYNFLIKKRSWEIVKKPLLDKLNSLRSPSIT